MNRKKAAIGEKTGTALLMAGVCALAVLACLLAFRFDNKYTTSGPRAEHGILKLDEQTLDMYPVLMLIDAWEYYSEVLLTPNDFNAPNLLPVPDEYVFIGQYGGFDLGFKDASPHGSATYRLNIIIPDTPRTYMLELPEIFSAYRLFINGKEAAGMGDPSPQSYRPAVGNRTVSFEASHSLELIFTVSDFTHFYSGLVYPPAFGNPEAVSVLLSTRFLLRAVLCSVVAIIGLLALLIEILSRRKAFGSLYATICLCFIGYAAYPIVRTFINGYYPFYALEQISYNVMLALVLLLGVNIFKMHRNWKCAAFGLGLIALLGSAIIHITLPVGNLGIMYAFSYFMTLYAWVTAGLITFTAVWALYRNCANSRILLCGILVFDCALVTDRVLPLYEPIVTGWFTESAGFILVIAIGFAISKELADGYKEAAVLRERADALDRLLETQQAYYRTIEEKATEVAIARHDLRHHNMVISRFIKNQQFEELEAYMAQSAGAASDDLETYCANNIINVLGNHYRRTAQQSGISFEMRCAIDGDIGIPDIDLCGVLGNLLENAIEACCRHIEIGSIEEGSTEESRPFIRISITQAGSMLIIRVLNSTDASIRQSGSVFLSSKRDSGAGFGLDSVRAIARKHGGTAEFSWDKNECVFDSMVTCRTH